MNTLVLAANAQTQDSIFTNTVSDTTKFYKKRVLESAEFEILSSYYQQYGDNAAVTGGLGTEELNDYTVTYVISIPINDDDVLYVDASVSAYTSASSSNINPLDGSKPADPFVASSGASRKDAWLSLKASYTHSSDDRNKILSFNSSVSREFDYTSFGFGCSYTQLWNQKNTELSIKSNVFFDTWELVIPYELGGDGAESHGDEKSSWAPFNVSDFTITGGGYTNIFEPLKSSKRNAYSVGIGFSQILTKKTQGSLILDLIYQQGQLSTPLQRVYFSDIENSYIDNFHLAEDIERLPTSRLKTAIGGRLNSYINERLVVRTFYRYYFDTWGVKSHTFNVELPIKISTKFTLYPAYRLYSQTAANYFAPYDSHRSTSEFYTSDYDMSDYTANQYAFGVSYIDVFSKFHVFGVKLKSIDLKYAYYHRNSTFRSWIITGGVKFVMDKRK